MKDSVEYGRCADLDKLKLIMINLLGFRSVHPLKQEAEGTMSFCGLIFVSPDLDPSVIPKPPRGLFM